MRVKHSLVHVGFALSPALGHEFGVVARRLTSVVAGRVRNTSQERFALRAVLPCEDTGPNQQLARLALGLNWWVVAVGDPLQRGKLPANQVIGTQGVPKKPLQVVGELSQILICLGDGVAAAQEAFLADSPNAIRQKIDGALVLTRA